MEKTKQNYKNNDAAKTHFCSSAAAVNPPILRARQPPHSWSLHAIRQVWLELCFGIRVDVNAWIENNSYPKAMGTMEKRNQQNA